MPSMFQVNCEDNVKTPIGVAFPGTKTFMVVVSLPVPVVPVFCAVTRVLTTSSCRTAPLEHTNVSIRPAGHESKLRLTDSLLVFPLYRQLVRLPWYVREAAISFSVC